MQIERPAPGLRARALGGLLWLLLCQAAWALPTSGADPAIAEPAASDPSVTQSIARDVAVPDSAPSPPVAPPAQPSRAAATPPNPADLPKQRRLYVNALESLAAGDLSAFAAAKAQLVDYPLYPYLDYQDYRRRIPNLTEAEVAAFREKWKDSPIARRLYDQWMDDLSHRGAWNVFLRNYDPAISNAERQCNYLRALDRSGERSARWRGGTAVDGRHVTTESV